MLVGSFVWFRYLNDDCTVSLLDSKISSNYHLKSAGKQVVNSQTAFVFISFQLLQSLIPMAMGFLGDEGESTGGNGMCSIS